MSMDLLAPANFSEDRRYRYSLCRILRPESPLRLLNWCLLNPSDANETVSDPTNTRVAGFTAAWGYDGYVLTNAGALVDKNPRALVTAVDPVGPLNDSVIVEAAELCGETVVAWGAFAPFEWRFRQVTKLLAGRPLRCLGRTKDGRHPLHPLYLKATTEREPWA